MGLSQSLTERGKGKSKNSRGERNLLQPPMVVMKKMTEEKYQR